MHASFVGSFYIVLHGSFFHLPRSSGDPRHCYVHNVFMLCVPAQDPSRTGNGGGHVPTTPPSILMTHATIVVMDDSPPPAATAAPTATALAYPAASTSAATAYATEGQLNAPRTPSYLLPYAVAVPPLTPPADFSPPPAFEPPVFGYPAKS